MMKHLLVILALALNLGAYTQEDKSVSIIVSGLGETSEVAKANAIRSAIEQTYSAYISAKTDVLNDSSMINDIVSIYSDNLISYKVLDETSSEEMHSIIIEATVSISRLITFAQSKGFEIQVNGSSFTANLKQQRLNEKAEVAVIKNSLTIALQILQNGFDYEIETKQPFLSNQLNSQWTVEAIVTSWTNDNFSKAQDLVRFLLNHISLSESEIQQYKAIGKPVYELKYHDAEFDEPFLYNLRTSEGLWEFIRFAYKIPTLSLRFKLVDGIKYEFNGINSLLEKKSDVSLNENINQIIYQYFFDARNYGMPFDGANRGQMNTGFESIVSCQRSGNEEYLKNYNYYINLKNKLYPLDPYYFFSPKLLVTTFDFHNCVIFGYKQDISQSRYKLVYSEEELAKLTRVTCNPLQREQSSVDYDLKPYMDVSYNYDRDVLKNRTTIDEKTQNLFTTNLNSTSPRKLNIGYVNRTILTKALEDISDQLRTSEYDLERGLYQVNFSCIINPDGTISLRPMEDVEIKYEVTNYMTSSASVSNGIVSNDNSMRLKLWKWIKQTTDQISDYPAPVVGKDGGHQLKTSCYKKFSFTFYVE
jgi:hypothetical protein